MAITVILLCWTLTMIVWATCQGSGRVTASFQLDSSPKNRRVKSRGNLPFEWGRQNHSNLLISSRHFLILFFLIFYGPSNLPPSNKLQAFLTALVQEVNRYCLTYSTTRRDCALRSKSSASVYILYAKRSLMNSQKDYRLIDTFFSLNFDTLFYLVITSAINCDRTLTISTSCALTAHLPASACWHF